MTEIIQFQTRPRMKINQSSDLDATSDVQTMSIDLSHSRSNGMEEGHVQVTATIKKEDEVTGGDSDDGSDNELNEEEKRRMLEKLSSFSVPGVHWTTCIFEPSGCVVIRYYCDDDTTRVEDIHQQLMSSLEPPTGCVIELERLRSRPIYKKTAFLPGDAITDEETKSQQRIGACVSVKGEGPHALTTGHGLREGQQITSLFNEPLGLVKLVHISNDCVSGTCDVALVKLDDGVKVQNRVPVGEGAERYLSASTERPRKNAAVQKFCSNPDSVTGKIKHNDYSMLPDGPARCMAIVTPDEDEYFHGEGESGVVVTTVAQAEVKAVGMLMATEFSEKQQETHGIKVSLAMSLGESFYQLAEHPYCNGVEPRLCDSEVRH